MKHRPVVGFFFSVWPFMCFPSPIPSYHYHPGDCHLIVCRSISVGWGIKTSFFISIATFKQEVASTLLPAQLSNLMCVGNLLFFYIKGLSIGLNWHGAAEWFCADLDKLRIWLFLSEEENGFKIQKYEHTLTYAEHVFYNDFPKFWRKVCWLPPQP